MFTQESNTMKAHCTRKARPFFKSIVFGFACCALLLFGSPAQAETVVCDQTTISVNAENLTAEELITTIGTLCEIKVVLKGELFTEDVFSVQFENLSIRTGLDRVLRVLNMPNHMLHFKKINGQTRVVEISLIGEGGRERQLTPGIVPAAQEQPPQSGQALPEDQSPQDKDTTLAQQQKEDEEDQLEELIDRLYDILEEQYDNEKQPDTAAVQEVLRQALPPEMNGRIPEEILEELADRTEE